MYMRVSIEYSYIWRKMYLGDQDIMRYDMQQKRYRRNLITYLAISREMIFKEIYQHREIDLEDTSRSKKALAVIVIAEPMSHIHKSLVGHDLAGIVANTNTFMLFFKL